MSAHRGTEYRENLMSEFSWGFNTFAGDNCSVEIVVQLLTADVFEIILNGVLADDGL
jgi:hypothetical protein